MIKTEITCGGQKLLKRSAALALAATLLCPAAAGLLAPAAAQAQTPSGAAIQIPTSPPPVSDIKTILLFPFASMLSGSANTTRFNADTVGARVEDAVKLRLNVIGRYKANSFLPTLPQVQRALSESGVAGLAETDVAPPYDTAAKGRKLADQLSTDGFLIGTIEALKFDPTTRMASVTVSATLYNTTTGTAVKAFAATGRGVSYNQSDDPDALLQSAINDAAGHIVSALNASAPRVPETLPSGDYTRGKHSDSGSILLGILLASAIGIAISSSHHSSSGGGSSSTGTGSGGTGSGGTTVPTPPSPPTPN